MPPSPPGGGSPGEGQGGGGGGRCRRGAAKDPAGGWLRALVDIGRTAERDGLEAAARFSVHACGWQIVESQTEKGAGKGQARGHCILQKKSGTHEEITRRGRSLAAAEAAIHTAVLKRCLDEVTTQGVRASVEEDALSREEATRCQGYFEERSAHMVYVAQLPTVEERRAAMATAP